MFIVNGQPDTSTPADLCAQFYYILCQKGVPAELHIYGKGDHGFGLGLGPVAMIGGCIAILWAVVGLSWLSLLPLKMQPVRLPICWCAVHP